MSGDKEQQETESKKYEDLTHFENFSNFMSVWDQQKETSQTEGDSLSQVKDTKERETQMSAFIC